MKKTHYSEFFVLINTTNMDIKLTKTAKRTSEITKCSRNTITDDKNQLINEWIVRRVTEE